MMNGYNFGYGIFGIFVAILPRSSLGHWGLDLLISGLMGYYMASVILHGWFYDYTNFIRNK